MNELQCHVIITQRKFSNSTENLLNYYKLMIFCQYVFLIGENERVLQKKFQASNDDDSVHTVVAFLLNNYILCTSYFIDLSLFNQIKVNRGNKT